MTGNTLISFLFFQGALRVNLTLPSDQWLQFLEQGMMLVLIFARWLFPKGELSRSELSQLLLLYLGLAGDIVDFFQIFDSDRILKDVPFVYSVLGAWSWSLLQFTIALTVTRQRARTSQISRSARCCSCMDNEAWSLWVVIILQDGPFLSLRLYAIIMHNVQSYSNFFFTSKNIIVILLQLYRFVAIVTEDNKVSPEAHAPSTANLGDGEDAEHMQRTGTEHEREPMHSNTDHTVVVSPVKIFTVSDEREQNNPSSVHNDLPTHSALPT